MAQGFWMAVMRLVGLTLLGYAAILIVFALRQRKLMYLPPRVGREDVERELAQRHLASWPSNGDYRGVTPVETVPRSHARGSVALFHGNATAAYQLNDVMTLLKRRGWHVVSIEFPGYPGRKGEPTEPAIVNDAGKSIRLMRRSYPGELRLIGVSLGTAVATALANDPVAKPDGIVLITPFDNMITLGKAHYPWLPVKWFLKDQWDSVAALQGYTGPIHVVMAGSDEVVPTTSTRKLLEAYPAAQTLLLPDAMHNDWIWLLTEHDWDTMFGRSID